MYEELWPNFFIVGAPKAGTTSLYHYLRQHPQIHMPVKDTYYFCEGGTRPIKEKSPYLELFSGGKGFPVVGEATANYLGERDAPYRIKDCVSQARILISLRDPVERAYSHFLMYTRNGRETKPFLEALQISPLATEYIGFSLYAEPIKRYWQAFGKERVMIVMFEDIKSDPKAVTRAILQFLCVDPNPLDNFDFRVHNPASIPRGNLTFKILGARRKLPIRKIPLLPEALKQFMRHRVLNKPGKPPMDPRAIELLRPIFEPDVKELEELLGRPIPELRKVW